MPPLTFHKTDSELHIMAVLQREQESLKAQSLSFLGVCFDQGVARSLERYLLVCSERRKRLATLELIACIPSSYFYDTIATVLRMDLFSKICIKAYLHLYHARLSLASCFLGSGESGDSVHRAAASATAATITKSRCKLIRNLNILHLIDMSFTWKDMSVLRNILQGEQTTHFDTTAVSQQGKSETNHEGKRYSGVGCSVSSGDDEVGVKHGSNGDADNHGRGSSQLYPTCTTRSSNSTLSNASFSCSSLYSSNSLRQISMSNCVFQVDALEELSMGLRTNTSLETFVMIRCGLSDSQIANVIDSLATNYIVPNAIYTSKEESSKTATISRNQSHQYQAGAKNEHPQLRISSLRSLSFFGNNGQELTYSALVRFLSQRTCQLQSLDLQTTAGNEPNRLQIEYLTKGWKRVTTRNKSLRRLVLSGNKIGNDDMHHIAILLRRFVGLEELDLESNSISDEGMRIFSDYTVPSRLRILRLQNNQLSASSSSSPVVKYILRMLQIHPELHVLSPDHLHKNTVYENQIRHYLSINRAGRVLFIRNGHGNVTTTRTTTNGIEQNDSNDDNSKDAQNPIAASVWPTVLARINGNRGRFMFDRQSSHASTGDDLNGMYYLLRNGPILFERGRDALEQSETSRQSTRMTLYQQKQQVQRKRKRKKLSNGTDSDDMNGDNNDDDDAGDDEDDFDKKIPCFHDRRKRNRNV